jgi:hypothetical protein
LQGLEEGSRNQEVEVVFTGKAQGDAIVERVRKRSREVDLSEDGNRAERIALAV